ncbi:glutamine amidotransferase-related protein [Leptolyngbya sp. AN02str]|uniref:glutamine amidotransferase-related protein n=1 Tax=Leptolyngbya sp. AN02str TaxID=3423363 RepID=UPI003D312188
MPCPSVSPASQILVIVHQETSTPGLVGQLLQNQGYRLDIRCPAIGHELPPTLEQHAATIVFGGPMSANDDCELPFIRTELAWVEKAIASQKPFLGICLGAQLLARVLGATVEPHPEGMMEIGYTPIQPNPQAAKAFNKLEQVYQWHREGFNLPKGATLLAQGTTFANQAFCYGRAAYGLQFHPEITETMISEWANRAAEYLERPEAQPLATQLAKHAIHGVQVESWLNSFLQHWVNTPARTA